MAASASLPPAVKWVRVAASTRAQEHRERMKREEFANRKTPAWAAGAGPGGGARPVPRRARSRSGQGGRGGSGGGGAVATVSAGRRSGAGLAPDRRFRLPAAAWAPALVGLPLWAFPRTSPGVLRTPARPPPAGCLPLCPLARVPCSSYLLSSPSFHSSLTFPLSGSLSSFSRRFSSLFLVDFLRLDLTAWMWSWVWTGQLKVSRRRPTLGLNWGA